MVGEKETFTHQWFHEWGHVFTRKIQQSLLFEASGKLFSLGGELQILALFVSYVAKVILKPVFYYSN